MHRPQMHSSGRIKKYFENCLAGVAIPRLKRTDPPAIRKAVLDSIASLLTSWCVNAQLGGRGRSSKSVDKYRINESGHSHRK